jgi:hypothetical protein
MNKSKPILSPTITSLFASKIDVLNICYANKFFSQNGFTVTFKPIVVNTNDIKFGKQQNRIVTSTNPDISDNNLNRFGGFKSQHSLESTSHFNGGNGGKLNKSKSANSSRSNSTYKALKSLRSNLEIRSVFKVVDLNKRGIFNFNNRGIFRRESSKVDPQGISFR